MFVSSGFQWLATCPSAGESGRPSCAHRTRPPLIEYAWKPAPLNACAAIVRA